MVQGRSIYKSFCGTYLKTLKCPFLYSDEAAISDILLGFTLDCIPSMNKIDGKVFMDILFQDASRGRLKFSASALINGHYCEVGECSKTWAPGIVSSK